MKLFIIFLFASCSLFSCNPTSDVIKDPAGLNHKRLPIKINGHVEVGIHGLATQNNDGVISLRAYGEGAVRIRGLGNCGYMNGQGVEEYTWHSFDLSDLPEEDICLYLVESRANELDAPAIGNVIVRQFHDPNVMPLVIKANNVIRSGVNWIQLQEGLINTWKSGISEGRKISVYPSSSSGKMIITGCGITPEIYEYKDTLEWSTTIDNLYKGFGKLDRDCLFTITANNDYTLKESASFLVSVYRGAGFLDTPIVRTSSSKTCFDFTDKYVVGIRINDSRSTRWNARELCIKNTLKYEVEAITANLRIFWGTYSNGKWSIK